MASKAAKKATTSSNSVSSAPKVYEAFYSSTGLVPAPFCHQIKLLEQKMGMPVVLLWHGVAISDNMYAFLNDFNYYLFAKKIGKLTRNERVAVVIFSPGGDARAAYKLACLLRKHCGGFTAVIPQYAKSAATLFALGADKIVSFCCGRLFWIRGTFNTNNKRAPFVTRENGHDERSRDETQIDPRTVF